MFVSNQNAQKSRMSVLGAVLRFWALFVGTLLGFFLTYVGYNAITMRYLNSQIGFRQSGRWFPMPLSGAAAVEGGLSLVSAGAAFVAISVLYGPLKDYFPRWLRAVPWIFLALAFLLKSVANG